MRCTSARDVVKGPKKVNMVFTDLTKADCQYKVHLVNDVTDPYPEVILVPLE